MIFFFFSSCFMFLQYTRICACAIDWPPVFRLREARQLLKHSHVPVASRWRLVLLDSVPVGTLSMRHLSVSPLQNARREQCAPFSLTYYLL